MIPLFELVLNTDGGVSCISLVDQPAMESGWLKLAKEPVSFVTLSAEKRILFGAILIPNKPILRINEAGEQYYIVFSKDTIEQIRNKYFQTQMGAELNAQHTATVKVNGFMVESFIKDSSRGMNPPEQFKSLPDGTWFGAVKVEDDIIWNRFVANNVFTGFSIEGNFQTKPVMDTSILDKFQIYLDGLNNTTKN